ncbi:MAG: MBL fold metallo-hydrolase [Nitrospiria bacterium]
MEITIAKPAALKLRGKSASLAVNPTSTVVGYAGVLVVGDNPKISSETDAIVFDGPGEFEVGGIKITGYRGEPGLAYNLIIDNVNILIGDAETLSKVQNKVKEADILLLETMKEIDAAFVSAYEAKIVIFYGTFAGSVAEELSKENVTKMSKFSITKDKLPEETQTVVLE